MAGILADSHRERIEELKSECKTGDMKIVVISAQEEEGVLPEAVRSIVDELLAKHVSESDRHSEAEDERQARRGNDPGRSERAHIRHS